jgi:hypothetical protein
MRFWAPVCFAAPAPCLSDRLARASPRLLSASPIIDWPSSEDDGGEPSDADVKLTIIEPAPKPTPVGVGAEGSAGDGEGGDGSPSSEEPSGGADSAPDPG